MKSFSAFRTRSRIALLIVIALSIVFTGTAHSENIYTNEHGEYYIYTIVQGYATLLKYGVVENFDTPQEIYIPSVINGYPLHSISANAFNARITPNGKAAYDESVAKKLILPEGLLRLETDSLNGAYGLREIVLPASLTEAQDGFWFDLTAVFQVSKDNPRYFSENGFLVDKLKQALIYSAPSSSDYPLPNVTVFSTLSLQYYSPIQIVFPQSTDYIASYTCYNNVKTQSVIIPGSVTTVDDNAFYAMEAYQFLLGDGIKHIGAYAFYDTEISSLSIPQSVEWLGYNFCQQDVEIILPQNGNCYWETDEEYYTRLNENNCSS